MKQAETGVALAGRARTVDALIDAVGEALETVTAGDCFGFFRHCGYTLGMN